MTVHHIGNAAQFETLLKENTYVVADFYADWCPPCRAIAPMYVNLASSYTIPGHLAFAKINVDHTADIAQRYGVTAMPTFLFFEKGKPYSGRSMIRGADPRSLQTVVLSLAKAANAARMAAESATAGPATATAAADESTVSGGYTMSQDSAKRADWKMSLTG